MKLSTGHFIAAAFSLVILVGWKTNGHDASGKMPLRDTIPKYEKIIVFKVPQSHFAPTLDSINYFLSNFGKAMTVDASDQWKQFFSRQFQRLISDLKIDSIKIK